MTTPNLTAVPTTAKPRKARGFVALGVVGALALSGVVGLTTLATQSAKDEVAVTYAVQLIGNTSSESAAFDLTPAAVTAAQMVSVGNTGGTGIKGHASFAPTPFTPTVPAALDDSIVRVWDTAVSGPNDPSATGESGYWEGTLREFLDTSFISTTPITGGESANFGVSVATPYDVDPNGWLMTEISQSIDNSSFVTLVVQTDGGEQSALTAGSTLDSNAGLRTAPASLVLNAAAALNSSGGAPVAFPAQSEDAVTVPGSIIRSFYTDPSLTTFIGSILLDGSLNEGDPNQLVNTDYDGDGIHLNLFGLVQAG